MKTSQIAAKVAVRLLIFLILLALVPVFTGNGIDRQLQNIYITTNNKWVLVYPILLIAGFVTLLILCAIKKYTKPDVNWLLVVNTVMLIIYGITVCIRISHMLK